MMIASAIAAAAALAFAAPPEAYEPTGEVVFYVRGAVGTGASFDAERIVGPNANLARTEGSWAGDIAGQNVHLAITDKRITGANVDLHLGRDKEKRTVRGNFFGQRLSLEYGARAVSGRVGSCSFTFNRKRAGVYEGTVGCVERSGRLPNTGYGVLRLAGDAAEANPPEPQFPLALMATLLG